jgi:YbgC/YbaW family acyl-CoA thioester hydrolase
MPRTKLHEQQWYRFSFIIRVQPRDINMAGHVGNENIVALVGTARSEMFLEMGFSELDLGDGETGIIMSDLVVNYKAEASMFDELLIETQVGELNRKGFRMFHRVTKGRTLIALMETV